MRVRIAFVSLICGALLLAATPARAQDFGVLESAETINRGNFKFGVYPMFVFPDPGDTTFLLPLAFGAGITPSFDLEGRVAFSDDVIFLGGDGEYWFLKNRPLDMSARAGFHFGFVDGDVGDTAGIDLSLLASGPVAERIELVGALDLGFNRVDLGPSSDWFTTAHLVPGVEVAITPQVDLVGEFGLGVTDNSHHYLAFGVAFYWR